MKDLLKKDGYIVKLEYKKNYKEYMIWIRKG